MVECGHGEAVRHKTSAWKKILKKKKKTRNGRGKEMEENGIQNGEYKRQKDNHKCKNERWFFV